MATGTVNSQISEVKALRAQKRFWSLGIYAALLVIVLTNLARLRGAVTGITQDGPTKTQFVTDVSERVKTKVLPDIQQMGMQALREIRFQDEVQNLNKRTPELTQASLKEIKALGDNLSKTGQKVLDQTFSESLKQREGKIREMFPNVTPEQLNTFSANMTEVAKTEVGNISSDLFSPHKKALDSIVTNLETIQHTEPGAKGETPTWEMGLTIFDIARADLKDLDTGGSDSKTKTDAKGAQK